MTIDRPSAHHTQQLLSQWKQVFGEYDGFWELFLTTAFSLSRCRCILDGETIAASLCWLDAEYAGRKLAYLYAVVTDPAYRGRGLCRKLMDDTHAHLSALGYAGALLVPAEEDLRNMYQKMGYQDATAVSEVSCEAGNHPTPLRAIGPEEYARLRRRFLPEDGVIQEGENLIFLAQQAEFFTGDGFLMAAYREEDCLHALELLGDKEAAPGIVRALNCRTGHFRCSGNGRPFAMFRPLKEDSVAPGYFGFAFD